MEIDNNSLYLEIFPIDGKARRYKVEIAQLPRGKTYVAITDFDRREPARKFVVWDYNNGAEPFTWRRVQELVTDKSHSDMIYDAYKVSEDRLHG